MVRPVLHQRRFFDGAWMMEQNACAGSSVTRHKMDEVVRTTAATESRILPQMFPGR